MIYEKRFKQDGSFNIYMSINVDNTRWRKVTEARPGDWMRYQSFIIDGGGVVEVPYVPVVTPFEQLRANKLSEIKSAYNQTRVLSLVTSIGGVIFKGGEKYVANITCALYAWKREAEPTPYKAYMDADENFIALTMAEHEQLLEDIIKDGEANFAKLVELEVRAYALVDDTPENRALLDNIKW